MRRLIKFLHSIGSAGLTGGAVALAVLIMMTSASVDAPGYAALIDAMAKIAAWVVGPSMVVTIISGLLAMLVTPAYQNAGWVWAKAATGILIFQAGLHALGPIQEAAKHSADGMDAATVRLLEAEAGTLWVLFGVSVANYALAIWRPRFPKYPV